MKEVAVTLFFGTCLFVTAMVGLVEGDPYPVFTSILGGGMVVLPLVLRHNKIAILPWWMTLVAGTVLLLHSAGIAFYLYDELWWWDILTHVMASVVLALVIALVLPSLSLWFPLVHIPARLVPFATIMSLIALGVIWEVAEFAFDVGLNTRMQYSLLDTVFDLSLDLLGGSIVALVVHLDVDRFHKASRMTFGPLIVEM